jgi:hypothetical protein
LLFRIKYGNTFVKHIPNIYLFKYVY